MPRCCTVGFAERRAVDPGIDVRAIRLVGVQRKMLESGDDMLMLGAPHGFRGQHARPRRGMPGM